MKILALILMAASPMIAAADMEIIGKASLPNADISSGEVFVIDKAKTDGALRAKRERALSLIEKIRSHSTRLTDQYESAKSEFERRHGERHSIDPRVWISANERHSKAKRRVESLAEYASYLVSGRYELEGLKGRAGEARLGEGGMFKISAPEGDYYLACIGSISTYRNVYWLVDIPESGVVELNERNCYSLDNEERGGSVDSRMISYSLEKWGEEKEVLDKLAAAEESKRLKEFRESRMSIYRVSPKAANADAVELLPAIGEAGTPENKEFVERAARYRTENPDFFNEPDWPVRLAEEIKSNPAIENPPK